MWIVCVQVWIQLGSEFIWTALFLVVFILIVSLLWLNLKGSLKMSLFPFFFSFVRVRNFTLHMLKHKKSFASRAKVCSYILIIMNNNVFATKAKSSSWLLMNFSPSRCRSGLIKSWEIHTADVDMVNRVSSQCQGTKKIQMVLRIQTNWQVGKKGKSKVTINGR